MATYAYPTRAKTLDTATVATLEDALNGVDIPQGYRNCTLLPLLLKSVKEPGLAAGQASTTLKLPSVSVKTKTQSGTRAEVFVNFESGVTAQAFVGLDPLNTSLADGPTVTWTDFSYYTAFVAIAGTEKIENTGSMKRLDILLSRQNQEIRTLCRTMEADLWSTNTDATKGTQNKFAGIRHKIAVDPTTSVVVQGLNQSIFTPWRNQTTASAGSFASGGLDFNRAMFFALAGTNMQEPPQLILTESTNAARFVKALEGIHRIVGSLEGGDLSSSKLPTFMGVPIGYTDDCPSGYEYWFNFDYMENLIHEGANWTDVIPGEPNDQWVKDQHRWIFGAAPLMMTRRERFGVISGITA